MNRNNLLKGFTDSEERFAFAKTLDIAESCAAYGEQGFTSFLDPHKTEKFIKAIQSERYFSEITLMAFGGLEDSERKIIGFSPDYLELSPKDFPITAAKIEICGSFGGNLTHRDFLGSILGLGIEREKIGDILMVGGGAFVLMNTSISDYVLVNLSKVAHNRVEIRSADMDELYAIDNSLAPQRVVVRSLRIDSIISAAYNMSRSKSSGLISSGKIFVNWICVENPSKQINIGDTITLRGVGRLKIVDIAGNTKKGGIVLEVIKKG